MTSEKDYSKNLDSTTMMVEDHVEKKDLTGVSSSISGWITKLGEYDSLKTVAADLEKLKAALSEKDGKKIVSLMATLGSETTKAAASAHGDEVSKIKNLGKALSSASKAISMFA